MNTTQALAALDELPEPTIVLAPVHDAGGAIVDLVFDYANAAAGSGGGIAAPALLGNHLLQSLPAFPPGLFDQFLHVLETGEPLRTQIDYSDRFAGGDEFSLSLELAASRLGDRLLLVYEDLAARAYARATERRYGSVLEATSDWVSIADRNENLVYINAGGRKMVGIGLDEDITGRRIGEFSPAWAREFVLREALEVARREGVWRGDLARLHRDGHEIPISQVIVARTGADGEIDFYATIARDMTRERAAEAALRESEERFRIAFEQAPIGMSLIDLEGRFVQVNDAYCATACRTREELIELGPGAIAHPDDLAFSRYALSLLVTDELPTFRYEQRLVDAVGDPIWVEISASLLRDAEGRPQFVIHMVQDLGERRIAHTLQRSMLTTKLPDVDGVELAVRYLPGTRQTAVGGDWYDVIPLPDGRVGVVVGDVVGRGIEAAATMSQLRTALRAYAIEGLQPALVVLKLNRLVDHLRVGVGTTLVYLDLDPLSGEIRYVSAGHMPLLHAPAQGVAQFLAGGRSTPLGTAPVPEMVAEGSLSLEPGDALLLYTDGLVERRDDPIDNRLAALLAAMASAPPDLHAALEHITATLSRGDALRPDDVALLAVRMQRSEVPAFSAAISCDGAQLGVLRRRLRDWLADAGLSASETGDVLIAVGEACANAVEHAGTPADAAIDVSARVVGGDIVLQVRDRGSWRPAEARPDRGQGLRLMRILMDEIQISRGVDGTCVELRRALARSDDRNGSGDDAERPEAAGSPDPTAASLTIGQQSGVPVARLRGEIDLTHVTGLADALSAAVPDGDRGLVLDLDAVDYLDSAGLHLIYDIARALAARGQMLRVVAAGDAAVMRLLELVDLGRTLALDATLETAVEALVPLRPPL